MPACIRVTLCLTSAIWTTLEHTEQSEQVELPRSRSIIHFQNSETEVAGGDSTEFDGKSSPGSGSQGQGIGLLGDDTQLKGSAGVVSTNVPVETESLSRRRTTAWPYIEFPMIRMATRCCACLLPQQQHQRSSSDFWDTGSHGRSCIERFWEQCTWIHTRYTPLPPIANLVCLTILVLSCVQFRENSPMLVLLGCLMLACSMLGALLMDWNLVRLCLSDFRTLYLIGNAICLCVFGCWSEYALGAHWTYLFGIWTTVASGSIMLFLLDASPAQSRRALRVKIIGTLCSCVVWLRLLTWDQLVRHEFANEPVRLFFPTTTRRVALSTCMTIILFSFKNVFHLMAMLWYDYRAFTTIHLPIAVHMITTVTASSTTSPHHQGTEVILGLQHPEITELQSHDEDVGIPAFRRSVTTHPSPGNGLSHFATVWALLWPPVPHRELRIQSGDLSNLVPCQYVTMQCPRGTNATKLISFAPMLPNVFLQRLISSPLYMIFLIFYCIFVSTWYALRLPIENLAALIFVSAPVLTVMELARMDHRLVVVLFRRFEFWVVLFSMIQHVVFGVFATAHFQLWYWNMVSYFPAMCLLVVIVFMDAAPSYPRRLRLAAIVFFLINSIRVFITHSVPDLQSDWLMSETPVCLYICADARFMSLSALSSCMIFCFKFLVTSLLYPANCILLSDRLNYRLQRAVPTQPLPEWLQELE